MSIVDFDGFNEKPSKIICIGRNYVDHIKELGNEIPKEMIVFSKPSSAITDQLASFKEEPLHYEGEICFLIKDGAYAAVGFGLDITKRALQSKLRDQGLPWERAKAFDGAALFSRFVTVPRSLNDLSLRLDVNEDTRQYGGVELMIYKPETILRELSSFLTLNDGDIVMTGTPKGVGQVNTNDFFCGTVFNGEQLLVSGSWRAS